MARARRLLPLASIVIIMLFLGAIDEATAMDHLGWWGPWPKCCGEIHIGRCIPNSKDDIRCDKICLKSCEKGGECKIRGRRPPNHLCHCYC
ncbi:Defensin-like protein [Sesbania bispinosa]|nr:Defensin-like protein [Sesbania bispinosa]